MLQPVAVHWTPSAVYISRIRPYDMELIPNQCVNVWASGFRWYQRCCASLAIRRWSSAWRMRRRPSSRSYSEVARQFLSLEQ